MIITNSNTQQSFNCMFRDGQQYTEGQLTVCVQKDGYSAIDLYTPSSVSYRPNFVTIGFDLYEEKPFVDGESYYVQVKAGNKLLFRDKLSVYDTYSDSSNNSFKLYTNDYTFTEDDDDEYTVLESPATGATGAGDTSDTDTSSDDSDNDGYGNVTRLGSSTPIVHDFNMMGEFTVDESQYGTFQTADAYTEYTVKDLNARQPSDVGTRPFYSQNGLADGFDGYVRYREGYDYIVANTFTNDMLDYPVDSGGTVKDYVVNDLHYLPANWDLKIYLDSTKTDINVGDSIYSDAEGTMLGDGTTNGKKNRVWFLWTDGDVVKVTAGVVTHKYNYKNTEDEKWIQFITGSTLKKQTYDGQTVTYLEDGNVVTVGKEWQGAGPDTDEPVGSLVTVSTIDDAATVIQAKLNDGWALVSTATNSAKIYNTFDFSKADPFAVGEQVYTRDLGFNAGRRLSSDVIPKTRSTSVYIESLNVTLDYSYKLGETYFSYLPIFGGMSSNFNFPDRRGVVLIEYDKYSGLIVNKRTIYRTNNNQ